MKRITMLVELDLGLVQDGYEVTQEKCEDLVELWADGGQSGTVFETLEIYARDIDTNIIVDQIIAPVEASA